MARWKPHKLEGRRKRRHTHGYVMLHYPEHPAAWKRGGWVYEHRVVMENHLRRYLESNECIHHKDANSENNNLENLEVTEKRKHAKTHGMGTKIRANELADPIEEIPCAVCGRLFTPRVRRVRCCSHDCGHVLLRRVEWPTPEELEKLVWGYPTSYIAEKFGVSDKAVGKWCKKYSIEKPPRGYWAKKNKGKRHHS